MRDLIEIRILKIAVEVGLVEGMMAATTPRGEAISTTFPVSRTTPTVRNLFEVIVDVDGRKEILDVLVGRVAVACFFVRELCQAERLRLRGAAIASQIASIFA